jgi:serine protease AprX
MPCEEDFWIEGVEWLEAQGADIVSSSLGYPDLYEYYRRDGKTALVSQAAHKAYKLGVLLVSAVGNARLEDTLDPGSLYPPSDADSILAVGGVITSDGTWLSPEKGASMGFGFYSAKGPTADGRTKPDLMAPVEAYMVNPAHEDSFWFGIGTSGATALTAGVAGLLLQAHPSWRGDPAKLRDCLLETGSMSTSPNDTMGWGIVRADEALLCEPVEVIPPKAESLLAPYPNPVRGERDYVTIQFHLSEPAIPRLAIYTMSGELVWKWRSEEQLFIGRHEVNWDLKNESGNDVASGIYIVTLSGFESVSIQKLAVVR